MTTYLTKTALQQYLEDRIAELVASFNQATKSDEARADELSSLLRLIGDGAFTVDESDNAVQQQDPIDELADLALHDHKAAVERIQVVQVQPVLLELRNRATELHDRANQAEKTAAVLAETVQGQIRDQGPGPVEAPAFVPNVYVAPASEHERLYNETGLRDRAGGR